GIGDIGILPLPVLTDHLRQILSHRGIRHLFDRHLLDLIRWVCLDSVGADLDRHPTLVISLSTSLPGDRGVSEVARVIGVRPWLRGGRAGFLILPRLPRAKSTMLRDPHGVPSFLSGLLVQLAGVVAMAITTEPAPVIGRHLPR